MEAVPLFCFVLVPQRSCTVLFQHGLAAMGDRFSCNLFGAFIMQSSEKEHGVLCGVYSSLYAYKYIILQFV